jgi:ribosomal protein S18 acetylase RimI-like enzyme
MSRRQARGPSGATREVRAAQEKRGEPRAHLPDGVEVRSARPQDAVSYLGMWREVVAEGRYVRTEAVRGTVRDYRKQFREAVTNDRARLMAVADGRVVGALFIERMAHPVNRHIATLGMAVQSSWRGKGIGTALMVAAMKWARSAGMEKVTLEVYPTNEAAVALYRKFGFVEEGRLERQSRKSYGYEDELIMSRFIS